MTSTLICVLCLTVVPTVSGDRAKAVRPIRSAAERAFAGAAVKSIDFAVVIDATEKIRNSAAGIEKSLKETIQAVAERPGARIAAVLVRYQNAPGYAVKKAPLGAAELAIKEIDALRIEGGEPAEMEAGVAAALDSLEWRSGAEHKNVLLIITASPLKGDPATIATKAKRVNVAVSTIWCGPAEDKAAQAYAKLAAASKGDSTSLAGAAELAKSLDRVRLGSEQAKADAEEALKGRSRIAVAPIRIMGSSKTIERLASAGMSALIDDLQYVSRVIPLERSETAAVFPGSFIGDANRENALDQLAAKLGVKLLLIPVVQAEGDRITLGLVVVDAETKTKLHESRKLEGKAERLLELLDESLISLLKDLNMPLDAGTEKELRKTPTENVDARAAVGEGQARLDAAMKSLRGRSRALVSEALALANKAIEADPRYLQAHLLKASCLASLGDDETGLADCLEVARRQLDESRVDLLTRLEFDGDYLTFGERDFEKAVESYSKILEVAPGHLRALWSIVAIRSGDFGAAGSADYEAAGKYSARLIRAHPNSDAAIFLKENR